MTGRLPAWFKQKPPDPQALGRMAAAGPCAQMLADREMLEKHGVM